MKAVIKVMHRSLVIEFYKQNAAFFGLILLVLFGFIRGNEHLVIGAFLINNPEALVFVYVLWLAYTIKVLLFLIPAIRKSENTFLESFVLLTRRIKITSLCSVALALLVPALSYGAFLVFLAIAEQSFLPVLSILGCLLLLALGLSYCIYLLLRRLPHEKQAFQIRLFKKVTLPPQLFFISYLIRKEPILLLLTKIYGSLLVIGTSALYSTDDFDLRLLTTGIMLAAVGNVAIMHKYMWFQYQPMAFTLNLPLDFFTIVIRKIISITLLMFPEMLVLIRHYPMQLNALDFFGLLLFAISLSSFMYAWIIMREVALSKFVVVVFWLVVCLTLIILYAVHPLVLGSILLAISVIFIYIGHYKYEHAS